MIAGRAAAPSICCDDCGREGATTATFLGFRVCVGCQRRRLRLVPLVSLIARLETPETLRAMSGLLDIAECDDDGERDEMLAHVDVLIAALRPGGAPLHMPSITTNSGQAALAASGEEFLPSVVQDGREVGVRERVDVCSSAEEALRCANERAARRGPTARAVVLRREIGPWKEMLGRLARDADRVEPRSRFR